MRRMKTKRKPQRNSENCPNGKDHAKEFLTFRIDLLVNNVQPVYSKWNLHMNSKKGRDAYISPTACHIHTQCFVNTWIKMLQKKRQNAKHYVTLLLVIKLNIFWLRARRNMINQHFKKMKILSVKEDWRRKMEELLHLSYLWKNKNPFQRRIGKVLPVNQRK